MLASRCVAGKFIFPSVLTWLCVASAACEMVYWAPDYMSYVNFPARISGCKSATVTWIGDSRALNLRGGLMPRPDDGRLVYYGYFGPIDVDLYKEMGPRLTQYGSLAPLDSSPWTGSQEYPDLLPDDYFTLPKKGILVLSPVALSGQYDRGGPLQALRDAHIEPDDVIGHNLLVFDLDSLYAKGLLH